MSKDTLDDVWIGEEGEDEKDAVASWAGQEIEFAGEPKTAVGDSPLEVPAGLR
jgi:hypothetical protein